VSRQQLDNRNRVKQARVALERDERARKEAHAKTVALNKRSQVSAGAQQNSFFVPA
jgi:hypothetical protein